MKYGTRILFLCTLALAGALSRPVMPVQAGTVTNPVSQPVQARERSTVKIDLLQELRVGAVNTVRVTLVTLAGVPITDQTVTMKVNGVVDRRGRTGLDGTVDIIIRQSLDAGPAKIEVDFNGSSLYFPSTAALDVEVMTGYLEIPVVPAIEGVILELDGKAAASGPDGIVRFPLDKSGDYLLNFPPQEDRGTSQIAFHRWSDDAYAQERTITFPLKRPLQVGVDVSYPVSVEFYDLEGNPVPLERVKSYTIKGSNGTPYTFTDPGPNWLPASRVTRRALGLEQTQILYSVMDVQVDGSNVVTQAQQRFTLESGAVWKINLLFYSASFTARDALFGFPLGSGVELYYPNGQTITEPFSKDKSATVNNLARGLYRVRVWKAPGFAPLTPMALSKNQEVDLLVVSYFDMIVVVAFGFMVATGLILIGRPGILGFLRKQVRMIPGVTAPVAASQGKAPRIQKDGRT